MSDTPQRAVLAEYIRSRRDREIPVSFMTVLIAAYVRTLKKHPELKGIFALNETSTQLGIQVLDELDNSDEIQIVGFDAGKEQVKALEDGELDGLVVQNPFGMGYAAVIASARTVLEIGNEAEVNTGYVWVTAENMDDADIKPLVYK